MTTVDSQRYKGGASGPYIRVENLSVDVNDFVCDGFIDCYEVYLTSTADINITGLFAIPGRINLLRLVTNAGIYTITLKAEDPASVDTNRIIGSDLELKADSSALLCYDYYAKRWRVVVGGAGGASSLKRYIGFTFQNSGIVLDASIVSLPVRVPFAGAITGWTMYSWDPTSGAPISGSAIIAVWKTTDALFPPTVANDITGSAKPTLTAATQSASGALTGWTTIVNEGDLFVAKLNSVTNLTGVVLVLEVTP